MARILGLGGLFFKSADADGVRDWYARVLGLEFHPWGGTVFTPDVAAAQPGAGTVFSPFGSDTDYFAPSDRDFMFNLMVDDLDAMLARCAEHGSLKRIHRPKIPAVHTHRGIEPRLFDHDVGQAAFLRVAAEADVQIALQSAHGRIRQRYRFLTFRGSRLGHIQTPTL